MILKKSCALNNLLILTVMKTEHRQKYIGSAQINLGTYYYYYYSGHTRGI